MSQNCVAFSEYMNFKIVFKYSFRNSMGRYKAVKFLYVNECTSYRKLTHQKANAINA